MIVCPRCEKEIHANEPHTCKRKMSRRFFFGIMAGAAVAVTLPKPEVITKGLWSQVTTTNIELAMQYKEGLWSMIDVEQSGDFLEAISGIPGIKADFRDLTLKVSKEIWEHPTGGRVTVSKWEDA